MFETDDSVVKETARIFGIEDKTAAEEVTSHLNSLLEVAFDLAFDLYSPYDGALVESGDSPFVNPADAVSYILTDIINSAPAYPSWALQGGIENEVVGMMANMGVSAIIDYALMAAHAMGRLEVDEDEQFVGGVEAGVAAGTAVLRTLVAQQGKTNFA